MKKLKAPFLAVTLILFGISFMQAATPPPPPPTARTANASAEMDAEEDPPCITCPVDFPINQNIIFLVISGLALGATVIYKNQIKKASN